MPRNHCKKRLHRAKTTTLQQDLANFGQDKQRFFISELDIAELQKDFFSVSGGSLARHIKLWA
jgi:hypothetical protein